MSAKVLQALSFLILTVTFERCVLHFLHLQVKKPRLRGVCPKSQCKAQSPAWWLQKLVLLPPLMYQLPLHHCDGTHNRMTQGGRTDDGEFRGSQPSVTGWPWQSSPAHWQQEDQAIAVCSHHSRPGNEICNRNFLQQGPAS